MADISQYTAQIELAVKGEEVRDSIVNALNAINTSALGVFDETPTNNSSNAVTSRGIKNALDQKQDSLTFDDAPTQNSNNPVKSGGVYAALQNVEVDVDSVPTQGSENPVSSGGVYAALQNVEVEVDSVPVEGSENPVSSGGVYAALQDVPRALVFDDTPVQGSINPVKSNGIYNAIRNLKGTVAASSITLLANGWQGNDPYTQVVQVAGATVYSMVSIQPGDAALQQMLVDNVRAMWVENNNGVFTVHAIGGVNSVDLTMQCTLDDTSDVTQMFDEVPTQNSRYLVLSGGVYQYFSALANSIASMYSNASTYAVGAYAVHDGYLYKCVTAISTPEDWTAGHWAQVSVMSETSGGLNFDTVPTAGSTNPVTSGGIKTALDGKQDALTFDNNPAAESANPVKSGGVFAALQGKQNTLTFDNAPTTGSINPVTSDGIKSALNELSVDSALSNTSEHAVENRVIKGALDQVDAAFADVEDQFAAIESSIAPAYDAEATYAVGDYVIYAGGLYKCNTAISAAEAWNENHWNAVTVMAETQGGQGDLVFDSVPTAGSLNPVTSGGIKTALDGKQATLTFDAAPTANSGNPVTSGGVHTALSGKVDVEAGKGLSTNDYTAAEKAKLQGIEAGAQVNVDPNWSDVQNKPTTLSGYGITDAYTKTQADALIQGKQDALTFDSSPTQNSDNPVKSGGVYLALSAKQDTLFFDDTPVSGSVKPVKSGGVYTALQGKQDSLTFDNVPTASSNNPVKSGGVYTAIAAKQDVLTFDSTPTASSNNPVTSGGVRQALAALVAGDIGYSDSSTYASGTVGAKLKAIWDMLDGLELVDDKPY